MIEIEAPVVYFAYVHIGKNPSPTLLKFARNLHFRFPESQLILITDRAENWNDFPGIVLEYSSNRRQPGIRNFLAKRREYADISNGYWLFTLERFLALAQLNELALDEVPIIHLESDVAIFLTKDLLNTLKPQLSKTALPRFSDDYGVGSIVYFPNKNHLREFIYLINVELKGKKIIENDMELLGILLNKGLVEELPSGRLESSEIQLTWQDYKIVFDGAAIGQYLLGQDPLHTSNRRISGYQNPNFPQRLSEEIWKIIRISENDFLSYGADGSKRLVLGLHVHAKVPLEPISMADPTWEQIIEEANQIVTRKIGHFTPDLIHSRKISFKNRMRIAKRNGLIQTLKRKVRNLVK